MIEILIYKDLDSVTNNHGVRLIKNGRGVARDSSGNIIADGIITRIGRTALQATMVQITYEVITMESTKQITVWAYMDMVKGS